jgi:copper chaperone NosL
MKKMYVVILVFLMFSTLSGMSLAEQSNDDISDYKSCKLCGMDRRMYDFSRMLIEYGDGTAAAFCSIHCAATDLAINIDKTPKSIKVGDFNGKQLIDAEKAFWVIGGNRPGVMSKRGKWAFASEADAQAFVKINRGNSATFEEAMKTAYEDMYEDTKMIRDKRKMKRMQMMEQKQGAGH